MQKWKFLWSQMLCCFFAPLMVLATVSPAAAAGAWYDGSTPVFRHVEAPSSITPTAMLQDRDGLIWIASQTGLASWDGYRFRVYIGDAGKPGSLPSSYINALHEDRQGRLWVGTDSGGLARFDNSTGTFWTLGAGPQGLSSARVFALAADGPDGLWVGTEAGLDRLDLSTGKVRRAAEGGNPPGLPARRISALLADRSGNLWAGTHDGLFVLRAGTPAFVPVPTESMTRAAIEVSQLAQDKDGRVWVGTRVDGAFVIEPGATMARQLRDSESGGGKGVETDWVVAIVDVGDGRVWLGTWSQGIVQVDTRNWTTRRLRHDAGLPGSLAEDDVVALLRDHSGLIWAGGPSLFDSIDPAQRAITTWYGSDGHLLGGKHAQVTSVFARPDGSVWLGSDNGGIDIVSAEHGHSRRLAPEDGRPDTALPRSSALSMVDAPDGSVYIGTAKGLYRTRDGGRSVERAAFPGLPPTALVRALCVDGNRLWIGGPSGLAQVDLSVQGAAAQSVPSLRGADITSLNCRDNEALWVGTQTGLARYWPATGHTDRPWPETPERIGLPSSCVTSIVRDRRGWLWIAFYGGGVRALEPGPRGAVLHVHRIGHEDGVENNAANALLLDAKDNVWVSTDSGIVHIDHDTLATTRLQQADGVGLLPYWASSAGTTLQGDLLFGGNGLTIVHPGEFQPSRFKAPIRLTDADGRSIPSSGITLGPSQRAIQITFALLDYSAPERTRYAYRLAGLEDAWTDSPANLRIAHYTNVPPGNYVLQVRASNRAGGEWTEWASLPVRVVPAWYETVSFRLFAVLFLLVLFGVLIQVRTRLLRRRAGALEALVAQRTQELQQRTNELQQRSDELVRRTAELQASEQRLEQLAYFDGLTGLANRRHFNDDLHLLVGQARRGAEFALVLVDLDRFKPINDTYGHDAGDEVLKAVGARLRQATREVDLVARLGGDEFAVLLRQPGEREAVAAVCERIMATFAQPVPYHHLSLAVGASIGVARCPQDALDAQTLYKSADMALYAAKEAGRGALRWAETSHTDEATPQ
jgi:diguanylate cyclase (GGDEF)-like protein